MATKYANQLASFYKDLYEVILEMRCGAELKQTTGSNYELHTPIELRPIHRDIIVNGFRNNVFSRNGSIIELTIFGKTCTISNT